MSKYDKEFKIDYVKIFERLMKKPSPLLIKFVEALKETKSVTYNWWWDRLTSNGISISGEDFIETAQVYAITSADIVLVLLYNDIDVKIEVDYTSQYATFKSEDELQAFMREMKHNVSLIKEQWGITWYLRSTWQIKIVFG